MKLLVAACAMTVAISLASGAQAQTPSCAAVPSTAPGSFQSYYANSEGGCTALLPPADYGVQVLRDVPSKDTAGDAPDVVFDGQGQAQVELRLGLEVDDDRAPDHLTFRGFVKKPGSQLFIAGGDANDISIYDYSADSFYINGAVDLLLKGTCPPAMGAVVCTSDFDPRPSGAPAIPNTKVDRGSPPRNRNVTIEGVSIHHFQFTSVCFGYGGTVDCHGEGFIGFGGENVVIRDSRLWSNWTYDGFLQWDAALFPQFSYTFDRVWFGPVEDGRGGVRTTALANGTPRMANLTLKDSVFASGYGFVDENNATFTNTTMSGNTFGIAAICYPGIVYTNNTWPSGDCDGAGPPPPPPPAACADGVDNDGDGKIDYPADPGCVDAADNDETDPSPPPPPPPPPDPDRVLFCSEFVPSMELVPYYSKWTNQNPGEKLRWEPFRDGICLGLSPAPPVMLTNFGSALVAAGKEAL